MPEPVESLHPERHFEAKYQGDGDPWGYRTSWYERRKYALTIAALPRERYRRVWEPACSIGELTALLADRADHVDASDISATAVRIARRKLVARTEISIDQVQLPAAPPGAGYDLVMLSEVLYYLPPGDREQVLREAENCAVPGADLVVVHWRHHPEDAWIAGAGANAEVRSRAGWEHVVQHEEPDFVLDVFTCR